MPTIPLEVLLGTGGLAAFLLLVARELWKSHLAHDADVRNQRDALDARLSKIVDKLEAGPKAPSQ